MKRENKRTRATLTMKVLRSVVAMTSCFVLAALVAFSPILAQAQSFAYVTNYISNDVSVIAIASNTVVATIPVGNSPRGLAITQDGAFVYVVNQGSDNIAVIAVATNTIVATVPIVNGGPIDVAITPDGAFAYVANFWSCSVGIINIATNTYVAEIPMGRELRPIAIAITANGEYAYVPRLGDNNVSVIATITNTVVATIPVGTPPRGIAISPDGASVYVTHGNAEVSIISTSSNTVVTTFSLNPGTWDAAFTPDGDFVYVTNGSCVSVMATATNTVVATIPGLLYKPIAIAFAPDGAFAYVVCHEGGVNVISVASQSLIKTFSAGAFPIGIAITPFVNHPPVADAGSDQTICAGSAIAIGGAPTASGGMGGPYTFSWSPTAGLDDPTAANPNAAPTATTTYTVTVTETATGLSDTDEMTLTVNPSSTANAGADKIIAPGQTVAIGGDPTAAEGTPPYTYSWSPTTGLDDPTASNPNATLTSTMTYAVEVTDAQGCKATDEVTINVHGFVLLANQHIEINRNKLSSSKGALHSNNTLYCKRGDPTTFTGNLEAVADITIDKENTIAGDVIAGGAISLNPSSTITGAATEHGEVSNIPIWAQSFSAGGLSYTVPKNGARTLAPGSYGNVIVGEQAKLFLSRGKYFFTKLETQANAELHCNVAAGVVQVHVTNSLKFGKETQVVIAPSGEAGSAQVCFMTQQSAQVLIDKEGYVLGTLIAPNAEVFVGKNTSYRGAICAQRIIIERDVTFVHHDSPGALPLPKASANDEAVMSEQPVPTQFELLQNYPNPFNPTTEMRFALPEASHVVLKIFNTLGEEVRTLVDARFEAGYHRAVWDGKDNSGKPVASGVYLYQLRAGEFAQVRKMSLVR